MPVYPYGGMEPEIADSAWIAPGARVIGDVVIGAASSIWYNVVVRGDVASIRIGAGTNIQDGTVVHVTGGTGPTNIGDDVLIGHLAMVHACTLEDRAYVGLASVVMDGCVIETDGMLGAGALLTPGKRIGERELWLGRPARFVRMLRDEEVESHRQGIRHYAELAIRHRKALAQPLRGQPSVAGD